VMMMAGGEELGYEAHARIADKRVECVKSFFCAWKHSMIDKMRSVTWGVVRSCWRTKAAYLAKFQTQGMHGTIL
jgi:hypothetical protein